MDIFAFAMKMEKDGELFYRELAQKTRDKNIAAVLALLADEEVRHYQAIQSLSAGRRDMAETTVLDQARNIFARLKEFGQKFDVDTSLAGVYQQAIDLERQSEIFYLDRADECKKPAQRELFLLLADEEKKHIYLLENIADFVSRPSYWLENAEMFKLEEY